MSANARFLEVPHKFRTEDITDNVLGSVGIALCVDGAQQNVTVSAEGVVAVQGQELEVGEHKLAQGTSLTLKHHVCRPNFTDCQWRLDEKVPQGMMTSPHRRLVVEQHG